LDAAGGGSEAVFGPIRSAAQKKAVSGLARKSPDLLDVLNQAKEKVNIDITPPLTPGASGTLTGGNNLLKDMWISIDPRVMRGRLPSGSTPHDPALADILTGKDTSWANTPAVVSHEAQHAVNRIAGLKTSGKLSQIARPAGNSLRSDQLEGFDSIMRDSQGGADPYALADEGLAYMRQNIAAGRGTPELMNRMAELVQILHPKLGAMFRQSY